MFTKALGDYHDSAHHGSRDTLPLLCCTQLTLCSLHKRSYDHCCTCVCQQAPLHQPESSSVLQSSSVAHSVNPADNSGASRTFASVNVFATRPAEGKALQRQQRPSRTHQLLQSCARAILGPVEAPYTTTITQITHFSGTRRPRVAAVLGLQIQYIQCFTGNSERVLCPC